MTYGYEKEKINGDKIINGNFRIIKKIGEGSFWHVYTVERDLSNDIEENKKIYVFKEGKLSFTLPNDDFIVDEEILNGEQNLLHSSPNDLNKNTPFSPKHLNIIPKKSANEDELENFEELYSEEKIKNGISTKIIIEMNEVFSKS